MVQETGWAGANPSKTHCKNNKTDRGGQRDGDGGGVEHGREGGTGWGGARGEKGTRYKTECLSPSRSVSASVPVCVSTSASASASIS
eukprot:3124631-Alexandrium_andersonii.AAC.1